MTVLPSFLCYSVDGGSDRDPQPNSLHVTIPTVAMWPPLPAVAVAFWSVVHEDVSSDRPCPVAGHVDHGADDKVVSGKRKTEGAV